MAAHALHCAACCKDLQDKTEHGRATHAGICRRKQRLQAIPPESRTTQLSPTIAEETEETRTELQDDLSPEPAPPLLPADDDTDKEWLAFWFRRGDVKMSLLADILRLARLGPPSFRNAQQMMAHIDALPGPSFEVTAIKIQDVETSYILRHRNLIEIAGALVRRFNGAFCDPAAIHEGEFVAGDRFRDLDRKLHAVEPSAVLMPLVLSSGLLLPRRANCCVV